MDERTSWLRLQLTPGLGRAGQFRLIEHFGTAQQAADAAPAGWPKLPGLRAGLAGQCPPADDPRLGLLIDRLAALDIWLLSYWDEDYPALLKSISDPPALLYGRGRRHFGESLAVVGSRTPSPTGRAAAETLAHAAAARGMTIVSGLARGVDAAAHRGALAAKGATTAVLGCGIDRVYPPENDRLYAQIVAEGTLLSEYLPGTDPLPGHFPGRNRIISGLSRATLVIEAAIGSGSLITAEMALEQGRDVLAVPGCIDRPTSAGPNRLIKEGAHPVTGPADIFDVLWPGTHGPATVPVVEDRMATTLSEPARSVWAALGRHPRHIDELSGELGLTAGDLSVILLHLELLGGIEQLPGARFVRVCHPSPRP